jgi:hypothetical protein
MKKAVFFCVAIVLLFTLSACQKTRRTDTLDQYLKAEVPLIYSEFLSFPMKDFLEDCTVNEYTCVSKSTLLFDDVYFLLSCTYTSQQYEEEIQRLASIGAEYRDDLFGHPAYVMLLYADYYEYAIVDEQNKTIVYIHAETADWTVFDGFPKEYLPNNTDCEICKYSYS